MLYKSLATLSFVGLASAFHGTGYEVKPYSDLDCLDYWGKQRCAKMAGKGFCVSDDECPSDKTFRCSKTRKFCAGTCRTCPAKCAVPDAVEGVYGGAFPAPGSGGNLEFPFFLVFEEGYGTLYMYGDKSGWCATLRPLPSHAPAFLQPSPLPPLRPPSPAPDLLLTHPVSPTPPLPPPAPPHTLPSHAHTPSRPFAPRVSAGTCPRRSRRSSSAAPSSSTRASCP